MPEHPAPSERARELVRDGFDPHVHVAPDFAPRRISDLELAQRCAELGLAGFGLKSHYTATAERAAVVTAARPGVRAIGTITLNHAVGGLNATAVEVAARQGARIVWLPTVSSENEFGEVEHADPDGKVPVWVRFELELRAAGGRPPPGAGGGGGGRPPPTGAGRRRRRRAAARAEGGAALDRAARHRAGDRAPVARRDLHRGRRRDRGRGEDDRRHPPGVPLPARRPGRP